MTTPPPIVASSAVVADFSSTIDPAIWGVSDGWTNGGMFNNGWSANNAIIAAGLLTLQIDDQCSPYTLCSGKPYKSGEYSSKEKYGFGTITASMTAAAGLGVVTSLFTYNAAPHDEIDIEILGKDTTKVQFNYFVNGVGGHETVVDLGFDAAAAQHTYAINWQANSLSWYVDGVLKHQVTGGTLPSAPGQVMVNLWPATGVDAWTGIFSYYANPIKATYGYIRFDPL
ncbi:MAG: family 16 glycosylhydrolase [Gallionellaceae bacterium]